MAKRVTKKFSNKISTVIYCVNEVLTEHGNWPPTNDDALMDKNYGYAETSMMLFLRSVRTKLEYANYKFDFKDNDLAFADSCLSLSVIDLKMKINRKTTAM